ncbi:MAG: hypothetical protein VW551_04945 [Euryarchaeota archaeon]
MITNAGKELIAKYLLGQVPSYASFISFGCGAESKPIDPNDLTLGYEKPDPNKQIMDFELIRVPITSRSYLNDNYDPNIIMEDRNVISLVGQLPFEDGMRINEVAIWSDSTNALTQSNSRMICAFTKKENWMWLNGSARQEIVEYEAPLSGAQSGDTNDDGVIIVDPNNVVQQPVFSCSNQNQSLLVGRDMQGTRYLNHNIMMQGGATRSIFIDGKGVDLPDYSSEDELRFAVAFYATDPVSAVTPNAKILVKFMKDPSLVESAATWHIGDGGLVTAGAVTSKYFKEYNVETVKLGDEDHMEYGKNFSWKEVKWIQIDIEGLDAQYFFAPDALRFDNIATLNPLYKMTGYTRLEEPNTFIEHQSGTNSYAQFRFELGTD